jgi:transcriptional repressor of dcmA and dcmR
MHDSERLLDIKQAARFLNVSETSLRRWTSSGQLGCARLGGRRERRFRRADLLAFLEDQPATNLVRKAHPRRGEANHPSFAGVPLPRGSHLCGLYASDRA